MEDMAAAAPEAGAQQAQYVYCLALGKEDVRLGGIGIDGSEVYSIVHNDICALVHRCPASPYQAEDDKIARGWVTAHHRVIETAWKRWGAVLPVTFNTIIKERERGPGENLIDRMKLDYGVLKGKLEAVVGKAEYVVQVFWDPAIVSKQVTETVPEMGELRAELNSKPRGLQYMYSQKLENLVRKQVELKASADVMDFYGRLSPCVDKINVEKNKPGEDGKEMLMNLSCLVRADKYRDLELALGDVGRLEGYSVRLAGPLPPYSFC